MTVLGLTQNEHKGLLVINFIRTEIVVGLLSGNSYL